MPAHLSIEQRWRMIGLHFDCHLSSREIARKLQCSTTTVTQIINLFKETKNVLERQGRGRPAIIQGAVRRQFRQILSRYPTSTSRSISTRLQSRTGKVVSARTIRRVRRKENYHPVHPKVQWTINEAQAISRFRYASAHETDTWQNVLFTDEKKFVIDQSGTVFWIPIGARCPKAYVNQVKFYVNVFGGVWYYGKSNLVFIHGSSNSTTYLQHIQLAINDYLKDIEM
ncbi:unnamed protein product [Rotaria sp. Silwood1]|nr:unnamed protein product [Rotaria sp. Silwood1]CAF5062342.1 unnamed protein product [Rotaria sp. Silwood1]